MSDEDALDDEMRHLRPPSGFGPDPLALDEGTAERLLAGQLHPADAPPDYRRAAMVLAAAAAPPSPDELAGERQAVAAFTAVARSIPHRAAPRRQPVLTRFVSFKLAAAATIAALSLAGVAGAATGTLPDPAQRVAHQMLGGAGVPGPDDHAAQTAGDKSSTTSGHHPTGPDATGAAKAGLCRAWAAGQGGENGKKFDATAFQALAEAAGGAGRIAEYCADVISSGGHGQQGQSSKPPTTDAEHGQGQGSGQGSGQGNGGGQGQGQGNGGVPPSTRPNPKH
ncbi:MAG TPA: hypothetical protein VGC06_04810 [Actinomycetes bacterium]